MSDDKPGVKFPPPFLPLFAVALGLVINRVWPMSVVPDSLAMPFGILFVATSVVLTTLGIRELKRHETTTRPDRGASTIVKTGPYRFSRNPLYVSLSVAQLGIGIWTNTLWIVLLLIPMWILMTTQVIVREEAHLERVFGEDYMNYKTSVRRWI